jgi:hypothetical protein
MPKLNLRNTSVLFTGALTAVLQYTVSVDNLHVSSWPVALNGILTILVAVHGAITNGVFANNKTAQEIGVLASEGETIVEDVNTAVQNVSEK